MMKNKLMLLIGGALLAAVTGCVSAPLPPMDRRVTLAENLGYDLFVTDVRCARPAASDFCMFQANVVNNTTRELWVEWRLAWLDANGLQIEADDNTWNNAAIAPKEIKSLQAVAPRRDAVDMRFYVRRMR